MFQQAFDEARAAALAVDYHRNQLYGERPYRVHLYAVRKVLLDFNLGGALGQAAWLHDTIEDTGLTREVIAAEFGEDVAALVWAVTGIGHNRKARVADAYAKIVDLPEAVFLKLADRIANVEASARSGDDKLAMYRKERPGFEAMVVRAKMADSPLVVRMLDRLNAAFRGEGQAR